MFGQMLALLGGQFQRHHSAQDQPGLTASRSQDSKEPKITGPRSHQQDSQVKYGEGGPLPQLHPPRLRTPGEAIQSVYQEGHLDGVPAEPLTQGREMEATTDKP